MSWGELAVLAEAHKPENRAAHNLLMYQRFAERFPDEARYEGEHTQVGPRVGIYRDCRKIDGTERGNGWAFPYGHRITDQEVERLVDLASIMIKEWPIAHSVEGR